MVKNWQKYRQMAISATLISMVLCLLYLLVNSEAANRQVAAFEFPQTIPLPGWELTTSQLLKEDISDNPKTYEAVLAAYQYQYQQNQQSLKIKNHYVVGTLGNIQEYARKYISEDLFPPFTADKNKQNLDIKEKPGLGFYTIIDYNQNYHLMACINPQGGSTVTSPQFLANRSQFDFTKERIIKWLLGQESLRDRRCLFTDLSLAKSDNSSQQKILEQAWTDWFKWWSQNFPSQ